VALTPVGGAPLILAEPTAGSLDFTSEDWAIPQRILVRAAEDVDTTSGTGTLTVVCGTQVQSVTVHEVDSENPLAAPVLVSGWPENGSLVAGAEGALLISQLLTVPNGTLSSIALTLDGADVPVFKTDHSFGWRIDEPIGGTYNYVLTLVDDADPANQSQTPISFTIDATPPVTTASQAGGLYQQTDLSVSLVSSEPATVYYSVDGYPPFPGAANTFSSASPITGIELTKTTHLQFFSIDAAGNQEVVQSEVYLFGQQLAAPRAPAVEHDAAAGCVRVSWALPAERPNAYRLYRAMSAWDAALLAESNRSGAPPPARLRFGEVDPSVLAAEDQPPTGVTWHYAICAVSESGYESPASPTVSVAVPATTPATTPGEAIERAVYWLLANQNSDGSWGSDKRLRLLHTAWALRALERADIDNAAVRAGLYWLRAQRTDSNRGLAEQILTGREFGRSDAMSCERLKANAALISLTGGGYAYGWGTSRFVSGDPICSALGKAALSPTEFAPQYTWFELSSAPLPSTATEDTRYGWAPQATAAAVIPSAIVYGATNDASNTAWLMADSRYGTSLIDTATVLLWIDVATGTDRDTGANTLCGAQALEGNWQGDAGVTALCLEALAKYFVTER
jgi:hypothetical protein